MIPQNSANSEIFPHNSKIFRKSIFSWENRLACVHGIFKMHTLQDNTECCEIHTNIFLFSLKFMNQDKTCN